MSSIVIAEIVKARIRIGTSCVRAPGKISGPKRYLHSLVAPLSVGAVSAPRSHMSVVRIGDALRRAAHCGRLARLHGRIPAGDRVSTDAIGLQTHRVVRVVGLGVG